MSGYATYRELAEAPPKLRRFPAACRSSGSRNRPPCSELPHDFLVVLTQV